MIENLTVGSRLISSTDRVLWKGNHVKEIKYNNKTVWETDDFAIKLTDEATYIRALSKFNDCRLGIDYYRITVNETDYEFNRDADLVLPAADSLGFKIVNGNFWESIPFPENLEKDKWLLFKLDETVHTQDVTLTQGEQFGTHWDLYHNVQTNATFRNYTYTWQRGAYYQTDQYDDPYQGTYHDWANDSLGTSINRSGGWYRSGYGYIYYNRCYADITTSIGTYHIEIPNWGAKDPRKDTWNWRTATAPVEYGTYELIQTN